MHVDLEHGPLALTQRSADRASGLDRVGPFETVQNMDVLPGASRDGFTAFSKGPTRSRHRENGAHAGTRFGGCMTAPQCLHVRLSRLAKKRSNSGASCVSMFSSSKYSE